MMKHHANSMEASTSKQEEVWYIDLGVPNHMMNHEEWFMSLRELEQLRYVEIGDDTIHTIEHIGDVPSWLVQTTKCEKG